MGVSVRRQVLGVNWYKVVEQVHVDRFVQEGLECIRGLNANFLVGGGLLLVSGVGSLHGLLYGT